MSVAVPTAPASPGVTTLSAGIPGAVWYPPVQSSTSSFERIDQGVDWSSTKPYTAIGSGTVYAVTSGFAGGTGTAVYIQLDHPIKWNGQTFSQVYYAETTPLVAQGQRVQVGEPVTGPGAAELGFANGTAPAAPLVGGLGAGTQPSSQGNAFYDFVQSLSGKSFPYTGSPYKAETNPLSGVPVAGTVFGAGQSVGEAAGSVVDTTTGFISEITSANFWIRALEMVAGFALVGMGLYLVLKDFGISTPTLPTPANRAADELEALTFEAKRSQAQARVAEGQSRVVTAQARQEYSPRVSRARAESAETTASSAAYSAEERAKQQRARTSRERANARAARSGATEAKRRAERARATEREQIFGTQMASDNPQY